MAAFAPSGFPEASLYSLSVPTAWPPALRAESEIPPPAYGRQPPFPKGGLGATDYILSRGPKGSLEPSTKPVAGQAAGPLGKPNASQNCPQLYQGESGGLEPAMKPMAGQAGAPLHSLSP